MNKAISIFLLLTAMAFSVRAQAPDVKVTYTTNPGVKGSAQIYYTAGEKLSVSDFEGAPDNGSNAVAITSSGFAFKAAMKTSDEGAELSIVVYCNFNKSKSWMKEKGKNKYILSHEQLHFDISFLGAMSFIQKLKAAKFTVGNYNKQLEKIYYAAITEMETKQHEYDSETMNGQLTDRQSVWIEKISKEIESFAFEF
jgi:hypothetical protein